MKKSEFESEMKVLFDFVRQHCLNAANEHHQLKQTVETLREALRKIADPNAKIAGIHGRSLERVYEDLALEAIKQTEASHD